jgi:hypothetical protein
MPCAKPRLPAGDQSVIARVAVGSADTPTPTRTRPISMPARLLVSPMKIVAADQIAPKTASDFRAPHLSATQPPMI